jgi:hypothetical protein
MYPQVSRIFMIPTAATAMGLEWARGRLESPARLNDHIAETTRAERNDQTLQFAVDSARLDVKIIRQTRPTERSSKRSGPAFSADERRFFDLIETVTSGTIDQLRKPKTESPKSPKTDDGWALISGANVLFLGGMIPQFLGLRCDKALRQAAAASGQSLPKSLSFEGFVDDRLGAGVLTALRVYLGLERLDLERPDLIPHRVHQVDWRDFSEKKVRESHALLIGSFGIDPR